MIVLNSAVADQLNEFKSAVDALIAKGETKEKAILAILKQYIKECAAIHFDGNGYSDEWKAEAATRGLDCETSVPAIIGQFMSPANMQMFARVGVFSSTELHARAEVKWETYTKKIQIEARVLGDLVMNHILPVASRYQSMLLDKVFKMKELFGEKYKSVAAQDLALIEKISTHMDEAQKLTEAMVDARKVANKIESERAKAVAYHDTVADTFDTIRYHIDKLEEVVDDEMWPLPKYRELLFVR